MGINKSFEDKLFHIINYSVFTIFSITMIYPIWHIVCLSISDPNMAKVGGFFFAPKGFSTDAYEGVLASTYIWTAFGNSAFITIMGVILSVVCTSGMAYLLSKKEIPGTGFLMKLVIFSLLFNGGMIPTYMVVRYTGLIDTLWALIIPGIFSSYNLIILRNFFQNLPPSLEESALIDGAGYMRIFAQIILPLSKPVLATIAIWVAVGQWNGYLGGLLYLYDRDLYILPLLVRDIVMGAADVSSEDTSSITNAEVVNAATIVIATVPILVVYPFLQKYFTKGIMLGSVKG